ncbi:MAG TPA: sensor histidine kinase [Gemmataceae bacterium]|nr:sensor histidine kinase [Gemmataceae bacterium]
MTLATVLENRVGKWVLWFLFWTLLGLSYASSYYISSAKAGWEVTWKKAVSDSLGDWYVFALLSIPVGALARSFRFDAGKWARSLAVHALGSAAFSLVYMVLRAGLGCWQFGAAFSDAFKVLLVKTWHYNLLIYWVIVAVSQAFDYYRKYRERELHASELEKHLAQAKLQALQMQLNPHFLFNTLHSISSLMHKDVEAADRMIMRLSDLLRAALEGAETQEVSLRKELDLLQLYLGIEQIRFGERLSVKMDIAPEAMEAQVPNLILQPLVENAIRHGIEPRSRPGRVEVHACRQADALSLEVCDNGNGMTTAKPAREGVGLSNTRARLRELYGEAHRFELGTGPEGGLRVGLTIPYRTANESNENSNAHRGR